MGRISLALVDKRRRRVLLLTNVVRRPKHAIGPREVRGAGQHHEIGIATRHEKRVVRLERNEYSPVAPFGDEIEAVIKELAEERHPGVEWSGETDIRSHVPDHENRLVVGRAEDS